MKRSRRLSRQIDSLRGLLRKRQNERKEWIFRGYPESEISAYFDPKIAALQDEILRLETLDDDYEEEEVYYVKRRSDKRRGKR